MHMAPGDTHTPLHHENDCEMGPRSPYRRRIRKSRGRGLRTRSGCLTCRKRHLKCDETKPTCGPCLRKDKACVYSSSARSISESADKSASDIVPEPGALESPGEHEDNASSAVVPSPVSFDEQEESNLDWTISETANQAPPGLTKELIESNLPPSHSPIAFQHSYLSPSNASFAAVKWFGLLASDAARETPHISTIPSSWANQSLSLDDSAQAQPSSLQHATQVLDSPAASHTNNDSGEELILAEDQIWQSRKPIDLLSSERTLFEHFIHHVSAWIDLFDPTNQFSTIIPHLAMNNAGLMNALLALASRHLHLNPTLDAEEICSKKELALQYYYQTLHYVQKAMQYSSYKTSLELLATTLIISAYEMLDNSTNDWERHLEGVFLIQRSQTLHGESGGLHAAVWWAWLCQDIWAAFREKRKTLTFFVPQKPLSSLSPHELATRSIYITAKVISYCAEQAVEENFRSRIDDAMVLHTMLDDWRRHLTLEFSPLPLGSRDECDSYYQPIYIRPAPFAVAVQFFSVSYILLLSHEPTLGGFDQYLERQSIIKRCVEDICGIATTLKDAASSLMSSQALFVAGMFCDERQDREAILELLELCRNRTGWPVRPLGDELQQIWKSQTKPGNILS